MSSLKLIYSGSEKGVSLIEVLISIVILSIALMGMAGLQASTTAYQLGVSTRTSLASLLNDVASRMRSNLNEVPGVAVGVTTGSYTLTTNWAGQASLPAAPTKLCGIESTATSCTSKERATYDLWAWRSNVRQTLPQGSVQINGDVNTGINVTFIWFDKDNISGGTLRTAETCDTAWSNLSTGITDSILNSVGNATLKRQTCCPATVAAPAGVRCANFTVVP